jgi:hypothetical protein
LAPEAVLDLDVVRGKGKDVIAERLAGMSRMSRTIRWYLTTRPRIALIPGAVGA